MICTLYRIGQIRGIFPALTKKHPQSNNLILRLNHAIVPSLLTCCTNRFDYKRRSSLSSHVLGFLQISLNSGCQVHSDTFLRTCHHDNSPAPTVAGRMKPPRHCSPPQLNHYRRKAKSQGLWGVTCFSCPMPGFKY